MSAANQHPRALAGLIEALIYRRFDLRLAAGQEDEDKWGDILQLLRPCIILS